MRMLVLLLFVTSATPLLAATVTTEEPGQIQFLQGADLYCTAYGGTFGPAWEWTTQAAAPDRADVTLTPTRRLLTATFAIAGTGATCTFREEVARADSDTLALQYDFTVNQEAELNSLFVSFLLSPCRRYALKTVVAYDATGTELRAAALPADFGGPQLWWQDGVARIEVAAGEGIGYTVRLNPAAPVLLQDNRAWGGDDFEIRVECLGACQGSPVPAGTQFSRPVAVDFPQPVDFQLDPYTAYSQTDTTGWVPYTMPWDEAPVDLSWLNESPAGGHGFLRVEEGRFAFEDGTPVRFWGVCNSAAANFPTHEQSEKVAARLARFGVNMVRTHHADAGWSTPNFFDETFGDTQHFDADALDRFDHFVSQLKQHGVYVYLDQLVHRKFATGDGVVNADQLDYAAKPYTIFDPRLIELQKQFSHDLWTHVNPYTGLAYKDDPAIALMEFTNENDLFTADVTVEPYATDLEQRWQDWAAAHGLEADQPIRLVSERSSDVLRFLDEVQRAYYAEMYAYLRTIGVQIPIAGNTWLVYGANLPSQVNMDFMDSHAYWDHPYDNYSRWTNRRMVENDSATTGNNMSTLSISRVHGKPFVVSEWGHPWPNEWRAEGALPMAAIGAFQSWDGVLAYTYRHTSEVPVDRLSGAFDTFNDPAVFGLFPAAALLYRRGDVTPTGPPTAVLWEESDLLAAPQRSLWNSLPSYRVLTEMTPLVTTLTPLPEAKATYALDDSLPPSTPTSISSDNGELHRDWSQGIGTINTPRTQAVYGNVGGAGTLSLADTSFTITTPFASVALSSLDGQELRASPHMLLTAVARVENTNLRYNLTHTKLQDPGVGPILIEPVTGQVTLQAERRDWFVYARGPNGTRSLLTEEHLGSDEPLTIDFSGAAGTIYYELVSSGRFRDVPFDYWACDQIEACALGGIVGGYDDGTYRPNLAVTRDQMAVFVSRALAGGDDLVPTGPATATFRDVPTDHWAFRYVQCAVDQGVVGGYDDGTYRPTLAVTRDQMAVFIARALAGGDASVPTGPAFATFPDVPAAHWAFRYVEHILSQRVTGGYPDGTYRPDAAVDRAQMAAYVQRAFSLPLP